MLKPQKQIFTLINQPTPTPKYHFKTPTHTSIQLPEVTRRQIHALAVIWGITDQPYEAKSRYVTAVIQRVMAERLEKENAKVKFIHNPNKLKGVIMYEKAKARVEDSPKLSVHADFILADWSEGNDHWEWVVTASEKEILDWVEAGSK